MLKILAIGNSFSQDATAYLYDIAKADGVEIKVLNLFIGGCSLERHWNNIRDDIADYGYQLNGKDTGRKISIKEALEEDEWDVVTLQQCSGLSGLKETYNPYIKDLSDYVSKHVPKAQQLIHETWAYEIDSNHGDFHHYDNNQEKMYEALRQAYAEAAKELSLDIIPCGDVIQKLRSLPAFDYKNGGISLCRDGFHMHLIYGRYALGLIWYKKLLKGDVLKNSYIPPSTEEASADPQLLSQIKARVNSFFED